MSDFSQLGLADPILKALNELGYEEPTPIQVQAIPVLLEKRDLLAQAQTGTGKTAAFALPMLTHIEEDSILPQVLVLTPTRELAIQVAESFYRYAKYLSQVRAVAIYGGQAFAPQVKALQRSAQVIVGTPGRIMDHLRRGSLTLEGIRTVVLDEADEMLNMGFIEDIEWILQQIKQPHQTALFSATMPASILKVTKHYLKDPVHVEIKPKTHEVKRITQKFCIVPHLQKLDALVLFLELEHNDATLIFTRTKITSEEIALKLAARGLMAAAINGDMRQEAREKVVKQLKNGQLDIVVATEVAARGLDIDRLDLVINYDIPEDPESYVHRIGRTGRAGREGKALSLVTPREKRMLALIERVTRTQMEEVKMPRAADMKQFRLDSFKKQIASVLAEEDLENYHALVELMSQEMDCDIKQLAAALAFMVQNSQRAQTKSISDKKPAYSERNNRESSFRERGRDTTARAPRRQNREGSYDKEMNFLDHFDDSSEKRGRSDSRPSQGSRGRSDSRSSSESRGRSDSRSSSESRGRSGSRPSSESRGRSDSRSSSESRGRSDGRSSSESRGRSNSRPISESRGRSDSRSSSESRGRSDGRPSQESRGRSGARMSSETRGRSDSRPSSESRGRSGARMSSETRGRSDSRPSQESRGRSGARMSSETRGRSDEKLGLEKRGRSGARMSSETRGRSDERLGLEKRGRSAPKKRVVTDTTRRAPSATPRNRKPSARSK